MAVTKYSWMKIIQEDDFGVVDTTNIQMLATSLLESTQIFIHDIRL